MDDIDIGLFMGIDVQVKRACSYFVLDAELESIETGWLSGERSQDISENLLEIVSRFRKMGKGKIAIGIDAPRMGLPLPRAYFWSGKVWSAKTTHQKGNGRHCEVVLKALNIANPQWTPLNENAPSWMQLGFSLFSSLSATDNLFEVFPSASYRMLNDHQQPKISISFANFDNGPRDMLDACISAYTVYEFLNGRGSEVGGGDGYGTIILPTLLPVPPTHPVLHWPEYI
jgi:hypothetical protein